MKPLAVMLALGVVRRRLLALLRRKSPATAPIRSFAGSSIATPYCSDSYLAKVARKYGNRVTGREVRNNPATKDRVCGFVGADPSVSGICNPDYQD
ncbi:MAG: hypothetical protein WDN31_01855 [Hyphomicrobium sp.]